LEERLSIQLGILISDIEKRIAEFPSLHSDSPGELSRSISKSFQALEVIFLSTFFPYWETDRLVRSIGEKCFRSNYQGQWRIVQEFLEQYQQSPIWFLEKFSQFFTTNVLFGNLKKGSERELRFLQRKTELRRKKPRKPQRKRGYNDKGTLRPIHQYHGERPLKEREDLRRRHNHPLLKDDSGDKEMESNPLSVKEELDYERIQSQTG